MRRRPAGRVAAAGAVTIMALIAAAAAASTGRASAAKGPSAAPAPAAGSIQHVVVVIQSGHSFDNYFGTRPGVDGIPPGACEPVTTGSPSCVKPYHSSDQGRAGLSDTVRAMEKAIDGGKMDHFVTAQPNTSIGTAAMAYFDRGDLPYYWSLADRFTLFDHFYAATPGGSLPNRLYAVAAQDAHITSNVAPAGGIKVPTVLDRLDAAGLPWKYYVQGYAGPSPAPTPAQQARTPLLAMPAVMANPALASRVTGTGQYFSDLIDGRLPAVSYISGSVNSERSPQDPAKGEAFVRSLVNALMQSSAWSHTALLLTYDDAGGWYDHSRPPTLGGVSLGLRVPALLISPYARSGFVDHAQVNTSSIPLLVEQVFHLPTLAAGDATAGSLLGAVDLNQAPLVARIAAPLSIATVSGHPAVTTVYILYLAALGLAVLLVAVALVRTRRRPPQPQAAPAPAGSPA